jgi:succinyl-CoA synthetase beta subunit
MKLHEYRSKQIFARYDIPIPRGRVAMTATEARSIAEELGGRAVIKAQVLVGGRGKAGGIRLAQSPEEAEELATQVLGMHIKGLPVRKVLVDQAADIQTEIYLGLTNDRATGSPVLIASAEGGIDIEEVARVRPEKIARVWVDPLLGLRTYQARNLAAGMELPRAYWGQFTDIARALYRVYKQTDASLAEINPLVILEAARCWRWMARDRAGRQRPLPSPGPGGTARSGREAAFERGPAVRPSRMSAGRRRGRWVNGAGLAGHHGRDPASGRPAKSWMWAACRPRRWRRAEIILSDRNVRVVLLNIFGGITRCDEVARGILMAMEEVKPQVPMVARLVGTNEEEGRRLLAEAKMITATSLFEGAERAVAAAKGEAVEHPG